MIVKRFFKQRMFIEVEEVQGMSGLFASSNLGVSKRRVFFSFHYQQDIWRVNQVRQSWRSQREDSRQAYGFFDASIWESKQRVGPDALKRLIRESLENTSVTCVLSGAETYARRWVRYELARSVARGNGLLTVRIDRMGDRNAYGSAEGPNPLDRMGVYNANGKVRIAEVKNGRWIEYSDYPQAIDLPSLWLQPHSTDVIPLSRYAHTYCYKTQNGHANFGTWIQVAAARVGR